MVKEIPIIFCTDMVRAITEGRKTQTRRIVKPQPGEIGFNCDIKFGYTAFTKERYISVRGGKLIDGKKRYCENVIRSPYGKPGDILWVREKVCDVGTKDKPYYLYKANGCEPRDETKKWKPSIHMPKDATRIWLEVESVRVERLQCICPHDAGDEGVEYWNVDYEAFEGGELVADYTNYDWKDDPNYEDYNFPTYANPVLSFFSLWRKLHGKESFESNPWVWVIEFKLLSATGKPELLKEATHV
jgi:hypothetical protein